MIYKIENKRVLAILSLQRKPGAKYFPKPDEKDAWNLKHQDEYIKIAEQLFAPLLK